MKKLLLVMGYGLGVMGMFLLLSHFTLHITPASAQGTTGGTGGGLDSVFGTVNAPEPIQNIGGGTATKPSEKIAFVLQRFISLIYIVGAIVFTVMILWGAVEWIMSGGSKDKIAAARGRIIHAIIGFILLALAFLIVRLVGSLTGTKSLIPSAQQDVTRGKLVLARPWVKLVV